jgi:hypothetical protein
MAIIILAWIFNIILTWLLIGASIWMASDPVAYVDLTVRWYCARYGRLPSRTMMAVSISLAIVLWPNVVAAHVKRWRGAR